MNDLQYATSRQNKLDFFLQQTSGNNYFSSQMIGPKCSLRNRTIFDFPLDQSAVGLSSVLNRSPGIYPVYERSDSQRNFVGGHHYYCAARSDDDDDETEKLRRRRLNSTQSREGTVACTGKSGRYRAAPRGYPGQPRFDYPTPTNVSTTTTAPRGDGY